VFYKDNTDSRFRIWRDKFRRTRKTGLNFTQNVTRRGELQYKIEIVIFYVAESARADENKIRQKIIKLLMKRFVML